MSKIARLEKSAVVPSASKVKRSSFFFDEREICDVQIAAVCVSVKTNAHAVTRAIDGNLTRCCRSDRVRATGVRECENSAYEGECVRVFIIAGIHADAHKSSPGNTAPPPSNATR